MIGLGDECEPTDIYTGSVCTRCRDCGPDEGSEMVTELDVSHCCSSVGGSGSGATSPE
jgi:hypothetical protein